MWMYRWPRDTKKYYLFHFKRKRKTVWNVAESTPTPVLQQAAENCLMRHLVRSLNTSNAAEDKTAYTLNINCLPKGKKKEFSFS